ncbi:MAG: alpha,alpha-trehalase TreF, partial [Gammaproteobacteria bacterium]|nr:alpha,alpha-trehalase TreF [Gammaproteobacteria bacterium]
MTSSQSYKPFSHDVSAISLADTLSPADRYQELFVAVQMQRIFPDSKTFVDCAPRRHPEVILEAYRARCNEPGFDLGAFVHEH